MICRVYGHAIWEAVVDHTRVRLQHLHSLGKSKAKLCDKLTTPIKILDQGSSILLPQLDGSIGRK